MRAHMHAGGDLLSLFLNDAKSKGEELSDEFMRDIILSVISTGEVVVQHARQMQKTKRRTAVARCDDSSLFM
jgi:cytochrome P450